MSFVSTSATRGASAAFTTTTTTAKWSLNAVEWDASGNAYVYVQADGAITANDAVIISEAGQADQLDLTNSNGALGDRVGVAPATFADNEYGWIQIHGACTLNVGSSAAVNTKLNSTSTAGRVDDDATAGSETVHGLYTTGAESSNEAAAYINIGAHIDATL